MGLRNIHIDRHSLRVQLVGLSACVLLAGLGVFCWQGWRNDTGQAVDVAQARLEALAATSGVALDGDVLQSLTTDKPQSAELLKRLREDERYVALRDTLALCAERAEHEGGLSTLLVDEAFRTSLETMPAAEHAGALERLVSVDGGASRHVDYLPGLAPALFEGRTASTRTPAGNLIALAPVHDSFGALVGLVAAELPWTHSLLSAGLLLAARLLGGGLLLGAALYGLNALCRRRLAELVSIEHAAGSLATGAFDDEIALQTRTSELVVLGSSLEALRLGVLGQLNQERRTNRKLLEAKRGLDDRIARQATQLGALDETVREPLARFRDALGHLTQEGDAAQAPGRLEAVRRAGDALAQRIGTSLQDARLESGTKRSAEERFDLAETVERAASPLRVQAGARGLGFRIVVPETLPTELLGDPTALQTALSELLRNAEAATESGSITLRVWPTASQDTQPGEVLLRFEVADTGSGIAEERLALVERALSERMDGDPQPAGRGGRGLARAAELVALLGGELAFESRAGVGTRFWFFGRFQDPRATGSLDREHEPAAALPAKRSAEDAVHVVQPTWTAETSPSQREGLALDVPGALPSRERIHGAS